MKRVVLVLAVFLSTHQVYPQHPKKQSPIQKFLNVFTPKPSPPPKRKAAKKKQEPLSVLITPTPTPKEKRSPSGAFIVDTQWIANYREQELAWSYPIPEDNEIKFENGQYHVPPVVYRHYEDLLKTPRPPDS